MKKYLFFKQFLKDFKRVGSIVPSSKYLARTMVSKINFIDMKVMVELGAGTGVFTKEIISRLPEDTIFLIFEIDAALCRTIRNSIPADRKNVFIINDSAENLGVHLKELGLDGVDCVISGLPFLSLKKKIRDNILNEVKTYLKGDFILFQYTLRLLRLIEEMFLINSIQRVFMNFPPAYVFRCSTRGS